MAVPENARTFGLYCPALLNDRKDSVTLSHGEGGQAMRRLIAECILPRFGNPILNERGDAAVLPRIEGEPVIATDSFVISPLFFPGGDIGKLCVVGTANDLIVAGAQPLWLSLGLILEEGLPMAVLEAVLDSIAATAGQMGMQVVTGDTKVVPRGAADGMFIATAGLGKSIEPALAGPAALEPGDAILVTGPIGKHGAAVICARENLQFDPLPKSDCGGLLEAADALRASGCGIRAMRDATRGGVAAVLHEWVEVGGRSILVDETALPVSDDVRGICELLGLDPIHLPNEGTMVVAVARDSALRARRALQQIGRHAQAAIVGRVQEARSSPVVVRRSNGIELPLDEPIGAPLPRIC